MMPSSKGRFLHILFIGIFLMSSTAPLVRASDEDVMATVSLESPITLTFNGEARCEKGILDIITETVDTIQNQGLKSELKVLISLEALSLTENRLKPQSFNLADGKQNPHLGVRFHIPQTDTPLVAGVFICVSAQSEPPYVCLRSNGNDKTHQLKYFNYMILYKNNIYYSKVRLYEHSYKNLQTFLERLAVSDTQDIMKQVEEFRKLSSPPLLKRKRSLEVVLPYRDTSMCKSSSN